MFTAPSWLRRLARLWNLNPDRRLARKRGRHTLPRRLPVCLRLEQLEEYILPSTYTVTTTADSGAGSLRQAILDSNGNAGANVIDFNITGSGAQTI